MDPAAADTADKHALLIKAATMLHRHGTPSHRMERVMKRVSQTLGVDADYLYTPTALLISFATGEHRTELRRIDAGEANLGKLIEFDEALEDLEDGHADIAATNRRLDEIGQAPPRFSLWPTVLAGGIASAAATVFFRGGYGEVLFAAVMGSLFLLWDVALKRWAPQEHAWEITSGFVAAFAALLLGGWLPNFDDRTATLGSLIILVPGFSFTVALMELANRHLSSGVARLAGAAVIFLALICGVALAWRLGSQWRGLPTEPSGVHPGVYLTAVALAPMAFAILFQARLREWGIIAITAWSGLLVTILASGWKGQEFGAFSGALAVGVVSNLYARFADRPALVPQMPATLMLVPGSLGYRSLAAFVDQKGMEGIQSAFSMSIVAISIVAGLLTANLVVRTRRIL